MSLTLRDAQHLSYKTVKKLENFDRNNAAVLMAGCQLNKTVQEITETLQNASLTEEQQGCLGKMLSEVLFQCFIIAEQQGISLEDAFLQGMDELILRFVS